MLSLKLLASHGLGLHPPGACCYPDCRASGRRPSGAIGKILGSLGTPHLTKAALLGKPGLELFMSEPELTFDCITEPSLWVYQK